MNSQPNRTPANPGLRIAELTAALSLATDMGTGQPLERALRTCLLAIRLGKLLGLNDDELSTVYYVALLRFVGCTADMQALADIFGDEQVAQARLATLEFLPAHLLLDMIRHAGANQPLPRRAGKLAQGFANGLSSAQEAAIAHCEVSQNIAQRLGLGNTVIHALGQLYERWDGRGPNRLQGLALSQAIRLVHLAQDMEAFYRIGGLDTALTVARSRAGGMYDPTVVACFCKEVSYLFADWDSESVWDTVLDCEPEPYPRLSETQFDRAIHAVADFTDLRSPYTYGHSSAVADLAYAAAQELGWSMTDAIKVYRVGLLHDVGRTAITLSIWDKNGPLTSAEWERVRLYPYYTERILARPQALAQLGVLAGLHRERLDGSGYHRGLPGTLLSPMACLLAAADIYQSKTEVQAYRSALSPQAATDELRNQVRAGKLDGEAVDAIIGVIGGKQETSRHSWPAGLSNREVEVLRLIAQGFSNRKMAESLCISPKTVGHHIQHIYDKLGISTRAAVTLFAMQHKLLALNNPTASTLDNS